MINWHLSPPARTALIYLLLSALWILFSDGIVAALVDDPQAITRIQTYKGWFFVSMSALLIFVLIRRDMRIVEQKNVELQEWSSKLEARVAERTADLDAANARLRELDALRAQLISEVSHELRSPITSMNLKLDMLERVDPQKQHTYIEALKKQVQQLHAMIEDVMDISWLADGESRVPLVEIDLNNMVRDVVELHRPMAEAAGLILNFRDGLSLPVLYGREQQLSRLVSNLLANAIKFTPKGSVSVHVAQDEIARQAVIQVQDSGIGIAPKDWDRLFDRFYRSSEAKKANVPGTGLGLSIVKAIVDLHGGTISVDSQLNQGTTFTVRLPFKPAA
ncbi:MAG: HAMP domain-containing histidine kinase [Anaerolineae bacterium]|nr:HAMP domain-containing histidine kinase [Anaerolineae bacterium]